MRALVETCTRAKDITEHNTIQNIVPISERARGQTNRQPHLIKRTLLFWEGRPAPVTKNNMQLDNDLFFLRSNITSLHI